MSSELVTDLFAYGTLKRGECRESMWPYPPVSVRTAYIQARLYDLGPYPAVRVDIDLDDPQDWDWVQGELWRVSPDHFEETLHVLDSIEGTNQKGHRNLYDQVLVRAYDLPGSTTHGLALVYHYSNAKRLSPQRRKRPTSSGPAMTPTPASDWREFTVSWTGKHRKP